MYQAYTHCMTGANFLSTSLHSNERKSYESITLKYTVDVHMYCCTKTRKHDCGYCNSVLNHHVP